MIEILKIVKKNLRHYPKMTALDIFKLIYQNEFGNGHIIENHDKFTFFLQNEYKTVVKNKKIPLIEDIGNGLVRVNLNSYKFDESYIPFLIDASIDTAILIKGNKDSFIKKVNIINEYLRKNNKNKEFEEIKNNYNFDECRPFSHSDKYRQNYSPSYRVVLLSKIKDKIS